MTTAATRFAKRWLYIGHRWLGIATCLLCAMWFVSGIVMMYVPYPRLTDRERLALLADIDWTQIAVSPDAAMRTAGLTRYPAQLRLMMFLGEPVYRIVDGAVRSTVSARDGRVIGDVDAAMASSIISDANTRRLALPPPERGRAGVGVPTPPGLRPPSPCRGGSTATDIAEQSTMAPVTTVVETLARDQWTVAQGFNPHRPLHKVSLNDDVGTELYVSSKTGEVVQDTTRTERFWNWLGSVPHWLYPTILRQDGDAWRQVVLWTSGPATVGAIAGLWIGILRLRTRHRYKHDRVTPYRGWMKWHHVAGLVAGVFLTTWLASGWLSVNPFRWFSRGAIEQAAIRAYADHDAASFALDAISLQRLAGLRTREAKFLWFDGRPLIVTTDIDLVQRVFDGHSGEPFTLAEAEIRDAARRLVPGAPLLDVMRLDEEDAYWYSHHLERKLPVLRARFGDDAGTWVHLDPQTGDVLGHIDVSRRVYRWLFNALHDFDVALLLRHRPAWDIVVWLLSLGGLIVSVSGVVIGWRRLGRKLSTSTVMPDGRRPSGHPAE